MPIPKTPDQIIGEGHTLLTRLGRHLDAVEQGHEGAGADLAAVLRILLDQTNAGNRGMDRISAALKVPLPPVFVTGGPELRPDGGLLMSFGNMPVVPAPGDGQPHTGRYLPFDSWASVTSLVAPGTQRRRESWANFATLVANTGGSHLGTEYHDLLVRSDLFDAVGLSLQDYLLRQVGWQVERVLADVLARSGRRMLPRTRRVDHWPRTPVWMVFWYQPGVEMRSAVSVSVTDDRPVPIEVMRFEWKGRTHHMFHNGGVPDGRGGGLSVQLVIDDADGGEPTTIEATGHPPGTKPPWES
jgi:hypothetical protein